MADGAILTPEAAPKPHAGVTNVCPFSITIPVIPMPHPVQGIAKSRIINGKIVQEQQMVLAPQEPVHLKCYGAVCALWVAEHEMCAFKVSALGAAGLLPMSRKILENFAQVAKQAMDNA